MRSGRHRVLRSPQRLRPGVQDADRSARGVRPLHRTDANARNVWHRQSSPRTITAAAACWRAGWSKRACGSCAVVSGGGPGNMQWDAHEDIEENHLRMAAQTDQPMAALLKDLKQRGLLDSTLVMIGRRVRPVPGIARQQRPRSPQPGLHHVHGGRRRQGRRSCTAPRTISAYRAVENPVHFRDIHTTILHQLGLNQDALSYMHQGRERAAHGSPRHRCSKDTRLKASVVLHRSAGKRPDKIGDPRKPNFGLVAALSAFALVFPRRRDLVEAIGCI